MPQSASPFLHMGQPKANSLAIVHLSRDRLQPLYLEEIDGEHDGYAEGAVLNTRFGSFPHSTFIGVPWGSQVRASKVDTGSRGRKPQQKKRKRDGQDEAEPKTNEVDEQSTPAEGEQKAGAKQAVAAASGFVHILAPSPELWTMSLPHRTQVVYTPDYSYILQRIRARPGSKIIEAGAGSGSFTHASARAVYNGVPGATDEGSRLNSIDSGKGQVFSFEFNEPRYQSMCKEISSHKLDDIVRITHRDVYNDGFLVDGQSPNAEAVFLDVPAPWQALPNLVRRRYKVLEDEPTADGQPPAKRQVVDDGYVSPLNPKKSVYLCTFSPCIEQVTRTISTMRQLGWMDIETVEVSNKRINVNREKIGLTVATERGMAQTPVDVDEAVGRLRKIEARVREHQKATHDPEIEDADAYMRDTYEDPADDSVAEGSSTLPPFMQGRLVTRTEADVRTHTSYLTFAVLPREWTAEDEAAALAKWPCGKENQVIGSLDKNARKQQKRDMLEAKRKKKSANKERKGEKGNKAAEPDQTDGDVATDVSINQQQQQNQSQATELDKESNPQLKRERGSEDATDHGASGHDPKRARLDQS
ncbi:hypothetical protein MCOR27_001864 [Pyricularia oryzae]|uniref:tRNA (adenine(58)-N(1))-methyltransferase catalytic subunit TRM61 n=1 Tax=Pyricularia grisea TaxID=148305 RepID=A0ABQ8NV63_PYRGI|nr:hypothetical protein MCOR01_001143 [Pyricularia oryzae]KAI6302483.1 hypothetical protein MCOR33_002225 [Pyricularia grisea]KAI6268711.1 hypothetical protein MCOR26_009067 [Pyricularia oryzae]KAI6286263.1 hypothetical protein MCOR27_001864 [Pyricularia oryzae]KAI6316460.1 hypothetical protein MCOR29_006680 [Pyricularia oryzae]